MTDILRPILELTVVLPGMLLAYLPMKHHLRIKPGKLALILLPLLVMLCICCGTMCWYFKIKTRLVLLVLVAAVTFAYTKTLEVSRWKSINVVLAICAILYARRSPAADFG